MGSNVLHPIPLRDPWAKAMCCQPTALFMSMLLAVLTCFDCLKTDTIKILWLSPHNAHTKLCFYSYTWPSGAKSKCRPNFEFPRMAAALGTYQRCGHSHSPELPAQVGHFRATGSGPFHLNFLGSFISKGEGRGCCPAIWIFFFFT